MLSSLGNFESPISLRLASAHAAPTGNSGTPSVCWRRIGTSDRVGCTLTCQTPKVSSTSHSRCLSIRSFFPVPTHELTAVELNGG
jgi:hypothetical protein